MSGMGEYDRTMKSLVDSNPEAIIRFVLDQLYKQRKRKPLEIQIKRVVQLNTEFPKEELEGDGLFLVEGPHEPLYLIEVEFQSTAQAHMPVRLLEYLAGAKKKHWKAYEHLPVLATVIWLFDEEEKLPNSPMAWLGIDRDAEVIFHYLSIPLRSLSRQDVLALGEPTLWPLALLTKEPVDRRIVERMFSEWLEKKLYTILPIGQVVASWRLRGEDLDWLKKEYQTMLDFFKDAPAYRWMEESAYESAKHRLDQEYQRKM
jgi:hypothetical protein